MCLYFDCIISINNDTIFTNIEDFNDSINLQEIPIEEWKFAGNAEQYVEYVEVLWIEIEHSLINKYKLIVNNETYDCGICFSDYENDIRMWKMHFKFCPSCYNNYHLKYKIDKCSHCRTWNYVYWVYIIQ